MARWEPRKTFQVRVARERIRHYGPAVVTRLTPERASRGDIAMRNRPAGVIRNPVLPGSHPDPSILRVGPDFYLATSTFDWYPGVRLHHSTDLVHWRPLGGALDDTRLVDLTRSGLSASPARSSASGPGTSPGAGITRTSTR
ncbi:hypothetical protein GCM10010304_36990 [Streptomyces roseoviolaceus]